jgi:hypothetical protein
MDCLNRDQEADRIIAEYQSSLPRMMEMLERQFAVLHGRAQVLLTLCGIVISTTGFSGRLIAGTNTVAQTFIIVGVALILLSAAVVCYMVLHLRWLTLQAGQTVREWLLVSLRYRDLKTTSYRWALVVLICGLTCYCVSIAIMLANPEKDALPAQKRLTPATAIGSPAPT